MNSFRRAWYAAAVLSRPNNVLHRPRRSRCGSSHRRCIGGSSERRCGRAGEHQPLGGTGRCAMRGPQSMNPKGAALRVRGSRITDLPRVPRPGSAFRSRGGDCRTVPRPQLSSSSSTEFRRCRGSGVAWTRASASSGDCRGPQCALRIVVGDLCAQPPNNPLHRTRRNRRATSHRCGTPWFARTPCRRAGELVRSAARDAVLCGGRKV